jgi:hypothetical protein
MKMGRSSVTDAATFTALRRIYAGLSPYALGLVIALYTHALDDPATSPERRRDFTWRLPLAQAEQAARED